MTSRAQLLKEYAKELDGCEYRCENKDTDIFVRMANEKLVAVFGASDDLIEFRGAIEDEAGVYDGGTVHLTKDGILVNDCEEDCPYFKNYLENIKPAVIEAMWCQDEESSWKYDSVLYSEEFTVYDDGEVYCVGIVFDYLDLPDIK